MKQCIVLVLNCVFGLLNATALPIEEMVGQLLMVHFEGETVNEEAGQLVEEIGVGGIVYYEWANGLTSPEQVHAMSAALQSRAREAGKAPLLIAVDQEGGRVQRLRKGFTALPSNSELAAREPEAARYWAQVCARELKDVGITMNLAPVVDVRLASDNSVFAERSFGECPEKVIAFAENALAGYHAEGIHTTLKHFPGYGGVLSDPHTEPAATPLAVADGMRPFAALAHKADAVMTAHVRVAACGGACATLSKKTLDVLRREMGFRGVIISDSLSMEAVLQEGGSLEEVAIEALNAGCDMLLIGGQRHAGWVDRIAAVRAALVEAVLTGRITMDRVEEAVERVFVLKNRQCK